MAPNISPVAAGIGSVIGQALATAIMDAAPSARAKRLVAAINEDIDSAALNKALMNKIIAANANSGDIQLSKGSIEIFERKTPVPYDKLKIDANYTLALDASALRAEASVSYDSEAVAYITPYRFANKILKAEQMGPIYRNKFSYHSNQLPVPEISDDIRAMLRSVILAEHAEDMAALTAEAANAQDIKKLEQRQLRMIS